MAPMIDKTSPAFQNGEEIDDLPPIDPPHAVPRSNVPRARPIEKKRQNIKIKCLMFQKSINRPKSINCRFNVCLRNMRLFAKTVYFGSGNAYLVHLPKPGDHLLAKPRKPEAVKMDRA